jgi:hypothetical protein
MTATQIDVKDYGYFADNQWRRAEDSQFFEVHECARELVKRPIEIRRRSPETQFVR